MSNRMKKPLAMIWEWRKGCSNGGPIFDRIYNNPPGTTSPARCEECTDELIRCLEAVLQEPSIEMIEDVAGSCAWDYRSEGHETRKDAREIFRVMTGAQAREAEYLHDSPMTELYLTPDMQLDKPTN